MQLIKSWAEFNILKAQLLKLFSCKKSSSETAENQDSRTAVSIKNVS